MDPQTRRLVEAIHAAPQKLVYFATGGGSLALHQLLSVPGASGTVLEASIPYGEGSLIRLLGRRPAHFCSLSTSRELALKANETAVRLSVGQPVIGVGCTATLATNRPKKGDHRFYLSIKTHAHLRSLELTLTKDARSREAEEEVLAAAILNAIAESVGIELRLETRLLPGEEFEISVNPFDALTDLLNHEVDRIVVRPDGQILATATATPVILAGSFNPVHEGHWRMAEAATEITGHPVDFELSVLNVDKPQLDAREVRLRARQFAWRSNLWITRAPTFARKAELFPGATFVVGADTAERLVAPRYYGDSTEQMHEAMHQIRRQGCRFLVAGREIRPGEFLQLHNLAIPSEILDLFTAIPESGCRVQVSSTNLRSSC